MMGIRRLEMDEVAREHWKLDGLEMELYYRFDKSEEMESKRELRCEMMEILQVTMAEAQLEQSSQAGLAMELLLFDRSEQTELKKAQNHVMTETLSTMTDEVVRELLNQAGLDILLIHRYDKNEEMVL